MKRKGTIMIACALAGSMLSGASVFAAPAEDGLLRTAIRYDITTMDVAKTTDDYMIPMNVFDRLFETRMKDGSACRRTGNAGGRQPVHGLYRE